LASIEKEVVRKVNPMGGDLPTTSDYPFLKTGTIWKITKTSNNPSNSTQSENTSNLLSSITAPYSGNNSTDIFNDK
jgi:hypothetical protein